MLQKEAPAIKPARAQKVKVHKPGLRAPAAGSAPSATRTAAARCLRMFSLFSQTCCFLLGHLGSWLHLGRNQFRSSVGCTAALSEALCESNNADGYGALQHMYFRTHQAPRLYAELDTRTMRPLRNPVPLLKRLPAAFATHTSNQSVVPRTHPIATPR